MRKVYTLLSALFVLVCSVSVAQVNTYTFTQSSGTYTPLPGGTTISNPTFDDTTMVVALPSAFTFNGNVYTSVVVSSNGWIAFNGPAVAVNTYGAISSTQVADGFIAPFAMDLENAAVGTPSIQTQTIAGVFIVQWQDVRRWTTTAGVTETISFQARLNLTTGVITLVYGPSSNIRTATTSPQVGLRGASNSFAAGNVNNRLVNTTAPTNSWATSGPGTVNTNTCRFSSTTPATSPASGQTYTFTPAACSAPGGLNASAITQTTATVGWNTNPSYTGFEWAVTTSATPPASGTTTTSNSANVSSLSAGTSYFLHVRAACGATVTGWSTISFATVCGTFDVPYVQDFETLIAPAVPTCMTVQNVNASTTWVGFNTTVTPVTTASSGTKSIRYEWNGTTPGNDWFFTPGINLVAGTTYEVSFKYKGSDGPSFVERLSVFAGTGASAAAMGATALFTNNNITSALADPFATGSGEFTPSTSGVYYFGFHCTSIADQAFLYVDDVEVKLAAACGAPNPTISNIAITGATVNWSAIAAATGYEIVVDNDPDDPTFPGDPTGNVTTLPLTGLQPSTLYYVHLRSVCPSGVSAWSTVSFTTALANDAPCDAIPLQLGGPALPPPGGQQCANTTTATSVGDPTLPGSCSTPNNTVWYSYTPTTNGTVALEFVRPATGGLNGWVAWYTATGACPTLTLTAVPGSACQEFGAAAGDIDTLISPVLTAGVTYYIMIDGFGGASGAFCVTALAPPDPPACTTLLLPVNGATGVNIEPTLTWNSVPGATSYQVWLGLGANPPINLGSVAGTTADLTGLLYDSTYTWFVVPVGAGGPAVGCNTGAFTFTVQSTPPNCVPLYTDGCTDGDVISSFRLKGESTQLISITGTTCTPNAYVDSTDHPTLVDLARGKSYWGQIQCGFANNYITIWIDGNDNGLFEDNERLMNNLLVGTTLTNINFHIPLSMPTGIHRLRIRNVYSFAGPAAPTPACASLGFGETEDYRVNILAGGSTYSVATYASTGTCYNGVGVMTVDSASNNTIAGVIPIVDSLNALVAQLYPNGNGLGRVTTSFYKHNAAVRQDAGGRYYLDRNITITTARTPTTTYNLRFPYLNAELNALIAQPGSGVTSQFDLGMTKNSDLCLNAIGTTGGSFHSPTGFGSIGSDQFLDFTALSGFSSFYLHGGSTPIPVTLLSFSGRKDGAVNRLTWTTTTEQSNRGFDVQRSVDGRNFETLRFVPSQAQGGFSSNNLNYTFTDDTPVGATQYYRLRQVDLNGRYQMSQVVRIKGSMSPVLSVQSIFPNPAVSKVAMLVDAPARDRIQVSIVDIAGRVVANHSFTVEMGTNTIQLDVDRLQSGTYLIKMVGTQGEAGVSKFIKQ